MTKAGCIEKVLQNFDCFITHEVYKETVVKGKERLHDDAFLLDTFVNEGKLILREAEPNEDAQFILSNSRLS